MSYFAEVAHEHRPLIRTGLAKGSLDDRSSHSTDDASGVATQRHGICHPYRCGRRNSFVSELIRLCVERIAEVDAEGAEFPRRAIR